ncbi:c-type cytochrome biogenesis protein CcmI [Marinobacter caseinilyticus]|uniref:c-type cytochrome biogenesis protein CcmI n=1 Tax=Marinobacter caseinilyticus TaxID=2692195 RepID=UPI00140A0506|nr:c-type cytochrome biogenesis protein CcmI [Marinobacter caseinilyticus]
MTTTFWSAAVALIGLALAFVLFPLFFNRPRHRAEADLRNQNLLAYRGRMAELEAEYDAGNLDPENYQQLKDELAGSLLDDVSDADAVVAGDSPDERRRTSARVVALAGLILIPVVSVTLYQQWGAMDDVEQWLAMQQVSEAGEGRKAQVAQLTDQLRARLTTNPDNPEGWAMLGRTYMNMERYPDAAWAFTQLAQQVAEAPTQQATALGLAAQARFFESQGAMTDVVTQAIVAARAINPDEVNSLGLLGIHAFEQKQFEDAIDYWERIAEVAPNHPQLPSIRQGIEQAYQRLGREAPASAPMVAAGVSDLGVTVRVTLDDSLVDQVPAETTLFVFARRPGAKSVPLAVVRRTAADLPLQLRLSDEFSMAPSAKISDAEEVVITARLSPSGNAIPQPGDWQGATATPVAVTDGREPVPLRIDQQLR